ncbi:hypothetical protein H0G86_007352 [Trichoderma simmonsii]|uniref:Uncharacterized protein n=1 Tax=Trichoderma simmonsii TaxID=1491479 RepID=A0A8G0PF17_9HYPO|nr:hypothetical protein H0G86_007352 [Trichoderma simmonsii]
MQLASSANAPLASLTLCWPGIDDMGPSINWPWEIKCRVRALNTRPSFPSKKKRRDTHNACSFTSTHHRSTVASLQASSMVLPTPPPPPFTSSNQDLQYQSHFEKLY